MVIPYFSSLYIQTSAVVQDFKDQQEVFLDFCLVDEMGLDGNDRMKMKRWNVLQSRQWKHYSHLQLLSLITKGWKSFITLKGAFCKDPDVHQVFNQMILMVTWISRWSNGKDACDLEGLPSWHSWQVSQTTGELTSWAMEISVCWGSFIEGSLKVLLMAPGE